MSDNAYLSDIRLTHGLSRHRLTWYDGAHGLHGIVLILCLAPLGVAGGLNIAGLGDRGSVATFVVQNPLGRLGRVRCGRVEAGGWLDRAT